jgi:hypothetical protein
MAAAAANTAISQSFEVDDLSSTSKSGANVVVPDAMGVMSSLEEFIGTDTIALELLAIGAIEEVASIESVIDIAGEADESALVVIEINIGD